MTDITTAQSFDYILDVLIPVSLAPQVQSYFVYFFFHLKCAFCSAVTSLVYYLTHACTRMHTHLRTNLRLPIYSFPSKIEKETTPNKSDGIYFSHNVNHLMWCGGFFNFISSSVEFAWKDAINCMNMKCLWKKTDNSSICMWNDRQNDYSEFWLLFFVVVHVCVHFLLLHSAWKSFHPQNFECTP